MDVDITEVNHGLLLLLLLLVRRRRVLRRLAAVACCRRGRFARRARRARARGAVEILLAVHGCVGCASRSAIVPTMQPGEQGRMTFSHRA